MTEQIAPANGIEIAYETFGDPADPTLLLVMGLGVQMLLWDEELCQMFVERGFHVVRFDNRDVGLSTKTPGRPPRVLPALVRRPRKSAYLLSDMADDAAGLLDHLEVDAAHVMGASMGGMISQTLAARHPGRVLSLVSIMSTTGNRRVGRAKPGALALLVNRPPQGREENIDRATKTFKVIGSPGFERDEARLRDVVGRSYDRCFHPAGMAHQLVAILASGNRTAELRSIQAPTLVIHGENDPLVGVSGGRATAREIPDARLMTIPGMGHDMPREIWPRIVDGVVANAERARDGRPAPAVPVAP